MMRSSLDLSQKAETQLKMVRSCSLVPQTLLKISDREQVLNTITVVRSTTQQ